MSYYENEDMYLSRGVDGDLAACLRYNPQDFALDDIRRVLAVWEGENDGDDWRWILLLTNGQYVALQGGCDYTGWDCQSSAGNSRYATIAETLAHFRDQDGVWAALAKQLIANAKKETWSEQTKRELGL